MRVLRLGGFEATGPSRSAVGTALREGPAADHRLETPQTRYSTLASAMTCEVST